MKRLTTADMLCGVSPSVMRRLAAEVGQLQDLEAPAIAKEIDLVYEADLKQRRKHAHRTMSVSRSIVTGPALGLAAAD
jgi:hypothetical protein